MQHIPCSIFDAANWFIKRGADTCKKIQKLCYYAQAWSLVFNNVPMFDSNFEAWSHGPVNRQLWNTFSKYIYSTDSIVYDENILNDIAKDITDENTLDVLERVWATYGEYSGFELERLARSEPPWVEARKGCNPVEPSSKPIDLTIMKSYYSSLLIADGISD